MLRAYRLVSIRFYYNSDLACKFKNIIGIFTVVQVSSSEIELICISKIKIICQYLKHGRQVTNR